MEYIHFCSLGRSFLHSFVNNGCERWYIGLIKLRLCVPGSLYATHVAQPVARLDAVGGVQGAKHAEQAVIITSRSSYMLVFWVILEMLMHIFHAVLSVCFPAPVWF